MIWTKKKVEALKDKYNEEMLEKVRTFNIILSKCNNRAKVIKTFNKVQDTLMKAYIHQYDSMNVGEYIAEAMHIIERFSHYYLNWVHLNSKVKRPACKCQGVK